MPSLKDLRQLRRRFSKWVWRTSVSCCCMLEQLEDWESMCPEDWEDKLMSVAESFQYGADFGHLVSVGMMREWGARGDFVRGLQSEDFLAPGSLLNPHPVLKVCLGFRNCELTTGKDYTCYCRVRKIFRGPSESDVLCQLDECAEEFEECEPMIDGIIASYWVDCLEPMLANLCQMSALRHRRSNFTYKKELTVSDAISSDPIHMMYVHIEGMIPQFGPFIFEVWRRNQGLHMGPVGDINRHGLGMVLPRNRRQTLEAELRQVFPNKPKRLKPSPSMGQKRRYRVSVLGSSASCIYASTVVGQLADALKKHCRKELTPFLLTKSSTNMNQSAKAEFQAMAPTRLGSSNSDRERGESNVDALTPIILLPRNDVFPLDDRRKKKTNVIKYLRSRLFGRLFRKHR